MIPSKTGILLINLGTPDSPAPRDVYRYLIEFLTDGRVIDIAWLKRQLLVRGIIVPTRYRQSAASYKAIWTQEGSPLMVYSQRIRNALQSVLDEDSVVEIAMRYQNPSIKSALDKLMNQSLDHLIVFPLFPQYASATTGSIYEKVMEHLKDYPQLPKLTFIDQFAVHPAFIQAFVKLGERHPIHEYDHVLFSFHGLPRRQLTKSDRNGWCLKQKDCCQNFCEANRHCYSSQCYATAHRIAEGLNLKPEQFSVAFQSRLGKDPWLEPYTSDVIEKLAHAKKSKVLVFCPSFVCDCLETIFEIGEEYQQEFVKMGGVKLDLVQGLNDEPFWVDALKQILAEHLDKAFAAR